MELKNAENNMKRNKIAAETGMEWYKQRINQEGQERKWILKATSS